ncbi:MAG: hypothetical protein ACFE9S_04270 [Candidatus Hermodarchaeota archaeon]
MIEEPLVFLGIYVISLALSNFLLSDRAGILKPIALRLFFIGVIFHELAHYLMSLVVGRIPDSFNIKWRNEDNQKRSPHGSIYLEKPPSFLQAVIIAFAPLYVSTWLIFMLWFGVIFSPYFSPVLKTIAVFICISLFLTASPSKGDLQYVTHSFRKDPTNSWYQILLLCISTIILWVFFIFTRISLNLDFFYYLAIAAIYLMLKFSFIGIRKIMVKIQSGNFKKPEQIKFNRFSRQHYKPKKPWKEK